MTRILLTISLRDWNALSGLLSVKGNQATLRSEVGASDRQKPPSRKAVAEEQDGGSEGSDSAGPSSTAVSTAGPLPGPPHGGRPHRRVSPLKRCKESSARCQRAAGDRSWHILASEDALANLCRDRKLQVPYQTTRPNPEPRELRNALLHAACPSEGPSRSCSWEDPAPTPSLSEPITAPSHCSGPRGAWPGTRTRAREPGPGDGLPMTHRHRPLCHRRAVLSCACPPTSHTSGSKSLRRVKGAAAAEGSPAGLQHVKRHYHVA